MIEGITITDNVSNMSHIIGGVVGAILGYRLNVRKNDEKNNNDRVDA